MKRADIGSEVRAWPEWAARWLCVIRDCLSILGGGREEDDHGTRKNITRLVASPIPSHPITACLYHLSPSNHHVTSTRTHNVKLLHGHNHRPQINTLPDVRPPPSLPSHR